MDRLMALDVGTKRIGVALSDFMHILSSGHSCIDRRPETAAVEKIKQIAKENNVKTIIVGIPINMDGTQGSQANDCLNFGSRFSSEFEVVYEDERLTSEMAEQHLKQRRVNYSKNKGLIDIESACIILEQYMGVNRG
ncbi:Holliday junction resolvase RuvX [bacterium]|nr:Holliday junction resolvase RuvX [bacterium]